MRYRTRLVRKHVRATWVYAFDEVGWAVEGRFKWWPFWFDCGAGVLYDTANDARGIIEQLEEL